MTRGELNRGTRRTRRIRGSALSACSAALVVLGGASHALAQSAAAARAAVISAEDRRAPSPRDLAAIRSATHNDPLTARIAVRALGRLERPSLIPDIVPFLRSPIPEIRAQAADAIAQAAQGLKRPQPEPRTSAVSRTGGRRAASVSPLAAAVDALIGRLKAEPDTGVRSAICESLGRLPFTDARDVSDAQAALRASLEHDASVDGRLGVAKGLLFVGATTRKVGAFDDASAAALVSLVAVRPHEETTAARVRRLAVDALTTARRIEPSVIALASTDPDAQVRRLAMKAAGTIEFDAVSRTALVRGLADASPIVRYEALRVLGTMPDDGGCRAAIDAAGDRDPHVGLLAFDVLGSCGWSARAVDVLGRAVHDGRSLAEPRGWHIPAHALVSSAAAAPALASAAWPAFAQSPNPFVRAYAARAAAALGNDDQLRRFATTDDDDNVREAAVSALSKRAGHKDDAIYVAELSRADHQLVRTAALALKGTPAPDAAVPALEAALRRLVAEGHDNSHDARAALAETLRDLGVQAAEAVPPLKGMMPPLKGMMPPLKGTAYGGSAAMAGDIRQPVTLSPGDLSRLQGARATITVRGVGRFDMALIAVEAPASASRFATLAAAGYYNGLTVHRIVPNFVIQGGSPGANEYSGDAMFMRDELGLWPHVRGAVGVSTRGRDTGDAQFFIDTVDNPRLDHEYTVFAQVLNGMDVVDAILEGDVIEKVELVHGRQP